MQEVGLKSGRETMVHQICWPCLQINSILGDNNFASMRLRGNRTPGSLGATGCNSLLAHAIYCIAAPSN